MIELTQTEIEEAIDALYFALSGSIFGDERVEAASITDSLKSNCPLSDKETRFLLKALHEYNVRTPFSVDTPAKDLYYKINDYIEDQRN